MDSNAIFLNAVRKSHAAVGFPKRVAVGLSGGADSVALLLSLCELQKDGTVEEVFAVHVNHGLRQNATADEAFCRELCQEMHTPFYVYSVNVSRHGSLEAAARTARYEAFERAMRETGAQVLALGHHADDQAETVLMHLLYGSGTDGLGGMRELNGYVWRPLLSVRRGEIRDFLAQRNQPWCEDESNRDTAFTRNRIRAEVLPCLESVSPKTVPAFCRAAQIAQDESDYLRQEAEDWLGRYAAKGKLRFLLTEPLAEKHKAVQRRILRAYAQESGLMLNFEQTERLRALLHKKAGAADNLPGGWQALRTEKRLHLIPNKKTAPDPVAWELKTVPADGGKGDGRLSQCIPKELLEKACLRTRQPGDTIQPFGMQGRMPLKEYLIDHRIDRPFRDHWPLLCIGQDVLWVIGVGAAEKLRTNEKTNDVVKMTFSGDLPDTI